MGTSRRNTRTTVYTTVAESTAVVAFPNNSC